MRRPKACAPDDTGRDTIRLIGHAGSLMSGILTANNVASPLYRGDFVLVVSVMKHPK